MWYSPHINALNLEVNNLLSAGNQGRHILQYCMQTWHGLFVYFRLLLLIPSTVFYCLRIFFSSPSPSVDVAQIRGH